MNLQEKTGSTRASLGRRPWKPSGREGRVTRLPQEEKKEHADGGG